MAGALPRTPLGELRALPRPLAGFSVEKTREGRVGRVRREGREKRREEK